MRASSEPATTSEPATRTSSTEASRGARLLRAVGYRGSGGLGKRENGAVEPVRVRVKRDRRGVGDPSAETYEVVGERRTAAKTREAAAGEEEEEEEETREDEAMKNIRARNEVARRREKEVTRAMFRAFKSGDVEADVNPLLRARGVDGGMSRTNPLRRLRG
jgi:NACalpha-BTF3-like transcription factor